MKRKNQEGAIVVEATISLTTFMFLIVIILGLVNICLVQAKMASLVHGVAKDLSNYSYIYSLTGLASKEQEIANNASSAQTSIDEVLSNGGEVYGTLEAIGNIDFDEEFWNSCVALLKQSAINTVKSAVLDGICKDAVKKRLSTSTQSADAYLSKLGIEGGVDAINFMESEFCYGGSDDIVIVATYKVHILKLLGVDFEFNFRQCAYTKAWGSAPGGDVGAEAASTQDSEGTTESTEQGAEATTAEEATTEEQEEITEEEPVTKSTDQYVLDSTRNPSSDQVMLGKYYDENDNYVDMAESYDMTYFSMDDEDWETLSAQGDDAVWEVNKRFLELQHLAGKTFYMSHNPYSATGYFAREVEWLQNKGYTFEYDPGTGLWRAELKES